MCRQFYRYCRDCGEPFPMKEPGMREPCKAFETARLSKPHLEVCPEEMPLIRPLSGHGMRVCKPCRVTNRSKQRERENAQKRARRLRLKKDKMTAGIGAGNVVWTPPKICIPSVMDPQTLGMHSIQSSTRVESTTQEIQYGLIGSIGRAALAQTDINISQKECGVYTQSCQEFASSMATVLPSREIDHDTVAHDMYQDNNSRHEFGSDSQDYTSTSFPTPSCGELKHEEASLDITLPLVPKWNQTTTETCSSSFNEWSSSFRMELQKWSTVFDEDFDCGGTKRLDDA